MKYLLRKEIALFFSSAMGYVIVAVWLLAVSLMLWVFGGDYNIPDSGYASLRPFFSLAPILLLLFVPAVTMRSFAEEKRLGTMELLLFRPIRLSTIVLSKFLSAFLLMLMALLLTWVYVFSVQMMSSSGMDMGELAGGYIALIGLIATFVSIGVFASSLTSNQLVAFLVAAFLSFAGFFGFDLLASLYSDGAMHNMLSAMGMNEHYRSLIRGVVDSRDIIYFLTLCTFFIGLTIAVNTLRKDKKLWRNTVVVLSGLVLFNVFSAFVYIRIDLTEGKRYTLSLQSRDLVKGLDKPLEVLLYLNGDLNPAFDRLRTATLDVLEELSQYATHGIVLREVNPAIAPDEATRQKNYLKMDERGIKGISVNERDREGKVSSKIVFPWLELVYDGDTVPVELLKKNINLSSQEVLNASVADLEYGLTDAVRLLTMREPSRIAFIEGHGEWSEPYVYEATNLLSRYYHVDRGTLSADPAELYPYKALIIASPQTAFTEEEKFVLDQYLMHGGSLFFLLDGVKISEEEFAETGESPTLKNELNLDDMLFTYGVRINPVTVQDMNCTPIRLASSQVGAKAASSTVPWYFAPLLEPVYDSSITRNISPLKSELVSTITWVGEGEGQKKTTLLTTSPNAHLLPVPEMVSLRYVEMPAEPSYFNESLLPVAGLIEGQFTSVFRNRPVSWYAEKVKEVSEPARIIVCASSSLIKNDWKGQGNQSMPLPLGYEPVTGEQLGNADFIVNAVNYLAGNESWLNLRARNSRLRLLNKQEVTTGLYKWQLVNVLLPLCILFAGGGLFIWSRRRKYHRR